MKIIHQILNPYKGVVAYFKDELDDHLTLSFANLKSIPMEILYLKKGQEGFYMN